MMNTKEQFAVAMFGALGFITGEIDEDDIPQHLSLDGHDATDVVTGLLLGFNLFVANLCGTDDELFGFTQTLQRLAVQHIMQWNQLMESFNLNGRNAVSF
jgi:hypothetical protein